MTRNHPHSEDRETYNENYRTKRQIMHILGELYEEALEMNNELLALGKGRPTGPFTPIGEAGNAMLHNWHLMIRPYLDASDSEATP
jgi:hypothetical protein